jgi:hypothetical protein
MLLDNLNNQALAVEDDDDIGRPISNIELFLKNTTPATSQSEARERLALNNALLSGDWSNCMEAIGAETAAPRKRPSPRQYAQRGRVGIRLALDTEAEADVLRIVELNRQLWWRIVDYGNAQQRETGRFPSRLQVAEWVRKERLKELPPDIAKGTCRAVYQKVFVPQMLCKRTKLGSFPPEEPSLHIDHIQLDMHTNAIYLPHIGAIQIDIPRTRTWAPLFPGRERIMTVHPLRGFLSSGKFSTRTGALQRKNGIWYFLLSFELNPDAAPVRDKSVIDTFVAGHVRDLFEKCGVDRMHVGEIATALGGSAQIVGKELAHTGIKSRNISIGGKQGRGYDLSSLAALFTEQGD